MQISVSENVKIKEKTIYLELEKLIISILAYFLRFKMATCLRQNSLKPLLG